MPYKGKPLIHGNPLYKDIHYNGKSFIQGEPLVNTMENHVSREILIQGNPLHVETPVT